MQLATIIGHATSTVKHETLNGRRLVIAQFLDAAEKPDGHPVIVLDQLGSGTGDRVIVTSDGGSIREMVGAKNTPIRFAVLGCADDV